MDETPLRTTDPLPFFVLFERVVDDNDDDAPVVVIVDDEDEEAAVRFIFSTQLFSSEKFAKLHPPHFFMI